MRILAKLALIAALGAAPRGPVCPEGCCCAAPPRTDDVRHGCCAALAGGHEVSDVPAALRGHLIPAGGKSCGSCTCVHGLSDFAAALPAGTPMMTFPAVWLNGECMTPVTPPGTPNALRPMRLANIDPAIPTVVLLI